MGEAMLARKGGAVLRGLEIISPPTRLEYYAGERLNMDGTIVGAQFGSFVIPLHETAWTYSPTRALTSTDTKLVISATIGRLTKTAEIPITIADIDSVLNNNSWESIAYAAQLGIANQLWSIGDIKTTAYGSWRIIGFDHDPLDTADAKYNDTSYNANKKKAAITFQWVAPAGRDQMNPTNTNEGGWLSANMNTTILPNLFATLPQDMSSVIRLVDKFTCIGGSMTVNRTRYNTAADRLFILGAYEVYQNPSEIGPVEATCCQQYAWYANISNPQKGNYEEWLRSPHDPDACTGTHFTSIKDNGLLSPTANASSRCDYYPAFCI